MNDVNKNVGIDFKITGIDTSKIKTLTNFFESLSKQTKTASTNIQSVLTNLKQLDKIKLPDFGKFASGFEKIASYNAPLTDLSRNFRVLTENITKMKGLSIPSLAAFANNIIKLNQYTTNLGSLEKKFEAIRVGVNKLNGVKIPTFTAFNSSLEKLMQIDVLGMRKKIVSLGNAIVQLDRSGKLTSFARFARDLRTISSVLEVTDDKTKKLVRSNNSLSTTFASLHEKFVKYTQYRIVADVVIAITQAIRESVKAVIEYDQALKDLQAITGATQGEVVQMGDVIRNVAASTKFSATEVAEGMRIIGQAGFSAMESMEAMQAVSDLATGTLSSMENTVDLVTTALRVFNLDASDSRMIVDVFASAVNGSKLTIDKLRTSFNYVGPIAKTAGLSIQDLSAAMMTLANSGLRASTIGTGLRQVFSTLLSPTKKFMNAVKASGVSMESLDLRTHSLQEVINALKYVVDDAGVALDAFGKRGAAAVLALTKDDSFLEMSQKVNRVGIAARQAEIQMEGLGVMIKNISDRIGVLAIAIGELGFTDILKAGIVVLRTFLEYLTLLVENPLTKFITKTVLLVGSLTAFLIIIKQVHTFITLFVISLSAMNVATVASAGSLGFIGNAAKIAATSFVFLASTVKAATAAIITFSTSHPFVAILTLISAVLVTIIANMVLFKDKTSEIVEENVKLAEEFDNLSDKLNNYKNAVKDLEMGSAAFKKETIDLRKELIKNAKQYPQIYKEAMNAADAIDIFDGSLKDGGNALKIYQEKLKDLEFSNLVKAVENATEDLTKSKKIDRYAEKFKARLKVLLTFDKSYTKDVYAGLEEGLEVVKLLSDGTVKSFTKAGDVIRSWNMEKLTDFQKEQVKNYDLMNSSLLGYINKLKETGKINKDTSTQEFEAIIKGSNLSQQMIVGLIATFEKLKSSKKDFSDVEFFDYESIIDPKTIEQSYKETLSTLKKEHEKYLHEIALAEAKDEMTTEEANEKRVSAELSYYEQRLKNATEYYEAIKNNEQANATDVSKALKIQEEAAASLYSKQKDYLVNYTKEVTKLNKKLSNLDDDYAKENDKHLTKIEKLTTKSKTKLEKLHSDYVEDKLKLDLKYEKKLEAIEEKRQKAFEKNTDEKYKLEIEQDESIRKIREDSMDEEEKAASQRNAAIKYYNDAVKNLQKFDVATTTEADLNKSEDLLDSALGLVDAFDSQRSAIDFVRKATENLKKVSDYKAQLKDAELLAEKEKELANKDAELKALDTKYAKEVQSEKNLTSIKIAEENKRHTNEINNVKKEVNEYLKKLQIAQELVRLSGGVVSTEIKLDADFSVVEDLGDNVKKVTDESKQSIDKLYETIDENGVRSFSNVGTEGAKVFKELSDQASSADIEVDPVVDENGKLTAFVDEVNSIQELPNTFELKSSVTGMDILDELISKIDGLKDKVVTVTTKYVTQGSTTLTASTGMRLPGFGGGDRRPALLEDGEWIINKFAVRKYGDSFLSSLNNMAIPKFSLGGPSNLSNSSTNSSSKGAILSDFGKVVLDTGALKIPAYVSRNTIGDIEASLKKIKRFAS